MRQNWKRIMGATAVAALLAVTTSPAALADGRGRGHGSGHNYGPGYSHNYGSGYGSGYGHNYGAGYGHRSGYGGGYSAGYRSGHHGGHRGGNGAGYFILGTVGGLLLGTAIANSNDRDVVYVPQNQVVTPVPEPAYNPAQPVVYAQGQCLQTREYTTTVIIGGHEEEAYGTACLQADGNWLKGPMQIAPRN